MTPAHSRYHALSRSMLEVSTSCPVFAACAVRPSGLLVLCPKAECYVGIITVQFRRKSSSMLGSTAPLAIRHTETSTRCGWIGLGRRTRLPQSCRLAVSTFHKVPLHCIVITMRRIRRAARVPRFVQTVLSGNGRPSSDVAQVPAIPV